MYKINDKKKNKLFVIINTFLIFAFAFVTHNLYEWLPSFVTTIFPVNESLYEHVKMIFVTPIIISTVLYIIFYFKRKVINNYIGGLFISTIFNIVFFYLIFLPIYNMIGENMAVTLIIYFISIVVSQFINYLIIRRPNNKLFNIISLILMFVTMVILLYFTYNPIEGEFFLDKNKNIYGIPNR